MAADTLSLRERIAQALYSAHLKRNVTLDDDVDIVAAILPVVEQEIQQAREEHGGPIPLNVTQEQAAKEWAADDRLWTTQETVEFNLRTFARVILQSALAEKDAQIAALQEAMQQFSEWLERRDERWMKRAARASDERHGDACDEHHVELVDVRAEFDEVLARLRETPAPPEPTQERER